MTSPQVTVLMSVHNGERHLREAMESVLAQTFEDFEFLIVDDASTDTSPEIARSFNDPRVRVVRNADRLGLTRSLNRGLAEARADLVARQDADDLSRPERLARQVTRVNREPRLALLGSAYDRIDENGRVEGRRPVPLDARAIRWQLLFLNVFTHSSVLFRRAAVLAAGGYDESIWYAQDYDLWSRLAERHEVAALPERLVAYRRAADSMSIAHASRDDADEVDQVSRRNIARITGSEEAARTFDRETAWRLLFSESHNIRPAAALEVARDVLSLQRAFAAFFHLGHREALLQRFTLISRIAERTTRLAIRQVLWGGPAP